MELDLGRSESNADQRLNPLWQQLQSILVAIATTLEPEVNSFELRTDESREAGTAEQLKAMLEQMKEPLLQYDPLPCQELMEAIRSKTWPEEFRINLAELDRQIGNYRLTEAVTTLERMLL